MLVLILLLLVSGIALTLPVVQTRLAQYLTEKINADYKIKISVDQVAVTVFGGVKLKKVLILDHHNDTLIAANRINTTILDFGKLTSGDLFFGVVRVDELLLNMKTYKGERESNLDQFIAAFNSKKPSSKKFLMKAEKIYLTDSHFMLFDENHANPKNVDFTQLNQRVIW